MRGGGLKPSQDLCVCACLFFNLVLWHIYPVILTKDMTCLKPKHKNDSIAEIPKDGFFTVREMSFQIKASASCIDSWVCFF